MSSAPNDDYYVVQVGFNNFTIDKRYRNLKQIGDGSYGFVASATDTVTHTRVAIKKVKDTFLDVVDAKRILREIKLLNHFDKHENIITIYDIMSYPPNKEHFDDIYIVTNLMESDLERIIKSKQALTDQHLQYFLFQILRGLKYVHSANVLHRDLKPSNVLVNANCDLAICDFGLARGFDSGAEMTEYVVTRWYRPPELLMDCSTYGKPVDVWGVGCIFAEVIVKEPFFRGDNPQHQLKIIASKLGTPTEDQLQFVDRRDALMELAKLPHFRKPASFADLFDPVKYKISKPNPLALDLLEKMLKFSPDERISVEDALCHPYLQDFHGQMSEPTCGRLFDFDFERRAAARNHEMTEKEVRKLMFAEVCNYRPCAEGKSGNVSRWGTSPVGSGHGSDTGGADVGTDAGAKASSASGASNGPSAGADHKSTTSAASTSSEAKTQTRDDRDYKSGADHKEGRPHK